MQVDLSNRLVRRKPAIWIHPDMPVTRKTNRHFVFLIFLACAVLTGCDDPINTPQSSDAPSVSTPTLPAPSAQSQALQRYYTRLQQDLLVQGLLRRDGGGADVPFSARDLERNFISIALFDEYRNTKGRLVAGPVASRLRRWDTPVRLTVRFGASVPTERRRQDLAAVSDYADRLSSLTGQSVRMVKTRENFTVLVLNEDERRAYKAEFRALIPGIDAATLTAFLDMPRSTLCYVVSLTDGQSDTGYRQAVAVIRAEHPDLLRLSCIHEEIAQGLGLANDSPSARPSIFNDNEEFGLLTDHDALLLQMLYDPRLKTGMTAAEARPIVRTLTQELTGEDQTSQTRRGN